MLFSFTVLSNKLDEGFIWGGHYTNQKWTTKFKKTETKDADFFVKPGKKIKVKMMAVEGMFRSSKNFTDMKFDWVELPFEVS